MIDIHNHILVDIDDGPKTIEKSIALLKQAKYEGVTSIVATPHHLHPRYDNTFQQVLVKLAELRTHPEVQALDIKLFPGQEIRITDSILQGLDNGSIQGINRSKYLLIEFPTGEVPHYTKQLFFEIQSRGYIPIIAHPERNRSIAKNPEILYELVANGALSQLTSSSLVGGFGKNIQKLSLQFIECNLAHFVASDAHSCDQRPFLMQELFHNHKLKKYSNDIEELLRNASSVINDNFVYLDRPTKPGKVKSFLKWF
ncbi:TPA: tyrosine-protein phosphatase [Staphylococcus aureus]|nr:tyrosine-protein phosphatase [Staphylococcus aureus]